jgi:hypothetical protein
MRWIILYARSRQLPAATAVLVLSTAVLCALGRYVESPGLRLALATLAVLAGATAVGPGLAGADAALDRTAAIAWPPRRAAHLIAGIVATAAAVAAGAATTLASHTAESGGGPHIETIARAAVGLGGLVGLCAAVLGTGRAWLVPVAWTVLVVLNGPATGSWRVEALTWLVQPVGSTAATATAVALGVAGTIGYAIFGAPRNGSA